MNATLRSMLSRVLPRRAEAHPLTYVISYPKSGRTWLRLMMGKALELHFGVKLRRPGDLFALDKFAKLDRRVPALAVNHAYVVRDGVPHPPSTMTDEELERDYSRFGRDDVILLVRDPRDVAISSWFRREKLQGKFEHTKFDGPLEAYLRHPIHGVPKIISYMNIWAENREVPRRFLMVRYEDLRRDPEPELRRIFDFLGVADMGPETLKAAIEYASFDHMREMEKRDELGSGRLRPIDQDDPDTFKVRRGKVGGYRDYLGPEEVAHLEALVTTQLDPFFGYGRTPAE